MNKAFRLTITAIIHVSLFSMPVFYLKSAIEQALIIDFLREMAIITPVTIILFFLLSNIPFIGIFFIALFFLLGMASNFFIYNFKKGFDEGVLHDLLTVEIDQTTEYLDVFTVSLVIIGFIFIFCILSRWLQTNDHKKNRKWFIYIFSACILTLTITTKGYTKNYWGYTLVNYVPYNVIWHTKSYITKYSKHKKLLNNKIDLYQEHAFKLNTRDKEPLTVVMIIGESMRGSSVSPRNMPLIHNRRNVTFFKDARSATTATRESLPFMLTSATFPNIDGSMNEKSFISIFKNLGFETSWIGSQGLFSFYEANYASIALESDYVIAKMDLRKDYRNLRIVDGQLLPYYNNRISEYTSNNLTIVHLYGSHWRFDKRLPEDFDSPFTPECREASPHLCSQEQIINSYENSFYYTDIVIDEILKKLENKNAFVIYSSDHGLSLGENGFFGNASKDPLAQKEQTDIAMFMWFSDYFLQNNPDILKSVSQHKQGPASHDYIFHSILDCAGVESSYINPSLSFCK